MTNGNFCVTVSVLTHNGGQRATNEDAVVVGRCTFTSVSSAQPQTIKVPISAGEPVVIAIADGLGGHQAGEVASAHVVHQLASSGHLLMSAEDVVTVLQMASKELIAMGSQDPGLRDMGSTVVGLLVSAAEVTWFNVGDSRAYRLTGGYLGQLSLDDTPTAIYAEAGETPVPTGTVTQALGTGATAVVAHTGIESLSAASTYLLCSDGLSDLVEVAEIEQVLSAHAADDETAVRALWAAAMNAGGHDNITIILARIEEEADPENTGSAP